MLRRADCGGIPGADSERGRGTMDKVAAAWRKSSYSGANGGNCVEVADGPGSVLVRDSKDPDGPRLAFGLAES